MITIINKKLDHVFNPVDKRLITFQSRVIHNLSTVKAKLLANYKHAYTPLNNYLSI